jgi:hypothetical protein
MSIVDHPAGDNGAFFSGEFIELVVGWGSQNLFHWCPFL